MPFIERLRGTEDNVSSLVSYSRGEEVPLSDHEQQLLDVLSGPDGSVHALGRVTLGRGIVTDEVEMHGSSYLVGHVEEDFDKPDGVWLSYVPL